MKPDAGGRLIDPQLFVADQRVRLIGSSCTDCGVVTFPAQVSCPRCTGQQVETTPLPTEGVVWAFTVQRFPPKSPYVGAEGPSFAPYAVGYIDLGPVLVESRLVGPLEQISIGVPVELVLEPIVGDGDDTVWTFAFRPTAGGNGSAA